jgi:hypothetical protein
VSELSTDREPADDYPVISVRSNGDRVLRGRRRQREPANAAPHWRPARLVRHRRLVDATTADSETVTAGVPLHTDNGSERPAVP